MFANLLRRPEAGALIGLIGVTAFFAVVGGIEFNGMSINVVAPPSAAASVARARSMARLRSGFCELAIMPQPYFPGPASAAGGSVRAVVPMDPVRCLGGRKCQFKTPMHMVVSLRCC